MKDEARVFREELERLSLPEVERQEALKHESAEEALDALLASELGPNVSKAEAAELIDDLKGKEREQAFKWLNKHMGALFASQVNGLLEGEQEKVQTRELAQDDLGKVVAEGATMQLGLQPEGVSMEGGQSYEATPQVYNGALPEVVAQRRGLQFDDPLLGDVQLAAASGAEDPAFGAVGQTITVTWDAGAQVMVSGEVMSLGGVSVDLLARKVNLLGVDFVGEAHHVELERALAAQLLGVEGEKVGVEQMLLLLWCFFGGERREVSSTHVDDALEQLLKKLRGEIRDGRDSVSRQGGAAGSGEQTGALEEEEVLWRAEAGALGELVVTMSRGDTFKLLRAGDGFSIRARRGLRVRLAGFDWLEAVRIEKLLYAQQQDAVSLKLESSPGHVGARALRELLKRYLIPLVPGGSRWDGVNERLLYHLSRAGDETLVMMNAPGTLRVTVDQQKIAAVASRGLRLGEAPVGRLLCLKSTGDLIVQAPAGVSPAQLRQVLQEKAAIDFAARLPGWPEVAAEGRVFIAGLSEEEVVLEE